ncbi:hypothetical protein FOVSG1_007437 [Fusarium oxysporum f. sp. vasinfectum]
MAMQHERFTQCHERTEKATFLVSHFHYAHDYVNKGCGLRLGSIRRPSCGIIMSSVAVYDLRIGAIAPAIKLRAIRI